MQTDKFRELKIVASIVAFIGLFLPWFSTNLCLVSLRTEEWFRYGITSLIFGESRFFESKRSELWYHLDILRLRYSGYFVIFVLMYVLFLVAAVLLIVNLVQIFKNKSQIQINITLTKTSVILLTFSGIGTFLGGLGMHSEIRNGFILTDLLYRLSFGYYVTLIGAIGVFVFTVLAQKEINTQIEN